jgi:hypothetical protein
MSPELIQTSFKYLCYYVPVADIDTKCKRVMVLATIFNNISVITWRFVLLEEETGVPHSW